MAFQYWQWRNSVWCRTPRPFTQNRKKPDNLLIALLGNRTSRNLHLASVFWTAFRMFFYPERLNNKKLKQSQLTLCNCKRFFKIKFLAWLPKMKTFEKQKENKACFVEKIIVQQISKQLLVCFVLVTLVSRFFT